MAIKLLFSEYFEIETEILDDYGALDICIDSDLPLFIDPFLLFSSEKREYQNLHDKIINHLIHLKDIAISNSDIDETLFYFPEVKQNWLGLCKYGNNGKGLGPKFAKNIIKAFNGFYSNFGNETVSKTSHIEKLTLISKGVGKDFISDFTTNLILDYLLEYTERFAIENLREDQIKKFSVRCQFDNRLQIWKPKEFKLPYFYFEDGDFILLTPIDILTKDEAFICHHDLMSNFQNITSSLDNASLRYAVNHYFSQSLPTRPLKKDIDAAIARTINRYPEILDYYIKNKEDNKETATVVSTEKVNKLKDELINTLKAFCDLILEESNFFFIPPNSYEQSLQRVMYLKDVIENNDGYRIFYKKNEPIASEDTIQRIFRLTWFASPYDVNSEVNNGRGPADYKISKGIKDSTIVEFKLAKSSSLKSNLMHQTEIYKKASKSISDIKVILCYTKSEIAKVQRILKAIDQGNAENIITIDASPKLSASKVS